MRYGKLRAALIGLSVAALALGPAAAGTTTVHVAHGDTLGACTTAAP